MNAATVMLCLPLGLVTATLGRLVHTGRPRISVLWTVLAAVLAALAGTALAAAFVPTDTAGVSWITLVLQAGLATGAVALAEVIKPGRSQTAHQQK
ncbi:GlsB/YeaQ/YmgE family stress response membrane protein [Streptomyces sp. NPDC058695]|uniref:GlsB/YeaQ/YmgE family stress response membrane protein n=1 Tax=Streptomyces sp. NPDC058695 TaxID=3346604 RepID=UPI00364DC082